MTLGLFVIWHERSYPCLLRGIPFLTHIDCNPRDTLVHFQGQYVTICELDYNILQVEIQNALKTKASVAVGEFCLVEDIISNRWYRGRVQNKQRGLFDVFLLDYGNVLTVNGDHLSAISDALLLLPPKIVGGFFANVLPVRECWDSVSEKYFFSLIGTHIKGYIHAFLPYKFLILEAPEVTKDLIKLSLGRHVDTDTFLLLVEMLVEVPVQQSGESVPDLLIQKQTAQKFSFRSSSSKSFVNILSFSDSKFVGGQKERARITAAVNPGLFYCQLSSVAKDLQELSEKLAAVCESKSSDCRAKPAENLGLLCAVRGKDKKWHRGFVQCLPVNSQVKVVFVDYGYCESVKAENVLQLPSDFLLTPIMARPCSLSCLNTKDEDTKRQQLGILRNALLGRELEFTVDGFNKERNVFAVTLHSVDGHSPIRTLLSGELTNGVLKSEHSLNCYPVQCTDEKKKVKISEDVFPVEEIQDGSVFEGYVEHVQNPNDFWIRKAGRNDSFEDMMKKLTAYFSGLQLHEEILDDPVPGVLCGAMYEKDMNYYRAVVVDALENGAEVFFFDFGNTEKVPSMVIKKLPWEFAVEPQFAFNCSLGHVTPDDDCWTVAATDFFRKVTSNKALLVHVIHKRNDTFIVELYESGTEKNESIAKYQNFSRDVCQSLNGKERHQKHLEEQVNTLKHSEANSVEMFRHQKILPGSELSVLCSHVTSPSDFWCQNKKQKADLDRLMEKLQDFYHTTTPGLQPHSSCCVVKLQQDNKWYRGYTLEVKNEEAEVILVDYGKVVKERLDNVRALMPEFLELEGQAFRCSLYNLIEPDGESVWSTEACTLFKDFVSRDSSKLRIKIFSQLFMINKGFCNVVDLQTSLQWATAHLVEKGVAVEMKCPKQLVPSAYPCSFVYSSFNIGIGSKELVYVTHVVSPWEIYFQLDTNCAIIDELMERTTKESEELLSRPHCAESGTVCLTKYFGDGKWYRSLTWPAPSSQHLNVFFVDYGNKQVAEKRNVLPISRNAVDLLLIPMQALRCSLSGIPKDEHLPEVNAWLEKTITNKELQAKFVAKNDIGHFICDLFDGNMHINEKIKELFEIQRPKDSASRGNCHCKEGLNVSLNLGFKATKNCHMETVVKLKRESDHSKVTQGNRQSSQKKSSKFRPSLLSHILNCSFSKDNQSKENYKRKHKGQISRTVQREKYHSPRTSNVQASKMLPKMGDLPDVKMEPGFRGVGFISHCDSSEKFFIQMDHDEQTILKIAEELNSSFFTKNMENVTSSVNVGDLVAAKFEYDLALYRAHITDVASSGALTVEFIDYGNTATVDRMNIHLLASQFLSHARLSIPCMLSKSYKFEDAECLIQEAHCKPLAVQFVQNHGYAWEVCIEIFDPLHASDVKGEKVLAIAQSKTVTQTCALNFRTQKNKVVKQKSFRRRKEMKVADDMQKLQTKRKPKYTYKDQDNENQYRSFVKVPESVGMDEQDVGVKDGLPVLDKPTLVDTCPEDLMANKDQTEQLFLAPVKVDFEYSGFAAAVTTPGEFYIILEDLLLTMNAVSDILENLPEVLSSLPESNLISGTGCLVRSGEKNKWCRAEIVQCNDVSVIINLVDYGHYSHFSHQDVNKLKRLPVELARLPKITYPCSLRGIKPAVENQWSDHAVIFFQECLCQKNLHIYFRQYVSEAQWEVDVITGGKNIAKELVDAGHACYIDSVLGIRFQQRLSHKTVSHNIANIMINVPELLLNDHEQTQCKNEELPQGNLDAWSADNVVTFNEEMSQGCKREGSKICHFESGQMTHHGSSSGLRQCKYPMIFFFFFYLRKNNATKCVVINCVTSQHAYIVRKTAFFITKRV
uniref:Tudor domain-containing protein n=1 Tax=Pygocentrus nattereri TaxID=42514 RepID=A0AAR2JQ13_PYGNA